MKVRCYVPMTFWAMVLPFAQSLFFAQDGLLSVINSWEKNASHFYLVTLRVRKLIFNLRIFALTTVSFIVAISSQAQPDTAGIAQYLKQGAYYLEQVDQYPLKPETEKNDMDSAHYFFDRALTLSQSIGSEKWISASLVWKGNYYIEANILDSGRACFQKAIDDYHSKGNISAEAGAWKQLGTCLPSFNARFGAEKARCLEHAYRLYWNIGDSANALESLKAAADAHLYEPNLDLSEKELLTVATIYKAIHFRNIYLTYDLLRVVAELKGDIVKEVFYTMEMVRSLDSASIKNREDPLQTGRLYCNAGRCYAYAAIWDRALFFARKGWSTLKNTDWDYEYFIRLQDLCLYLVHNDSAQVALRLLQVAVQQRHPSTAEQKEYVAYALGNCYQALGELNKAESEFSKITSIYHIDKFQDQPADLQWKQEVMITMGNFFLLIHKYNEAYFYSKRLPSNYAYINTFITTLAQRARIELFKSRVDSAMGHYQSALTHLATYQQVNDSLFGIQKAIQIQELQMRYALDKKDNDIRLQSANIKLLTRENEFQQMQADKSRTVRNTMVIALFFLVLLVGMVYNRYRVKQQRNRQLELKQEEITAKNKELEHLLKENEWLLQEIHHRVKNNLQTVTSLLTSQMDSTEKGPVTDAIRESRNRIEAMAMIHQRLYNSNNYSSIMMPAYVAELVDHLREAFKPGPRIVFTLLIEPITLDISIAISAALILNEAISNALKHAFPGGMEGTVSVSFKRIQEEKMILEVHDDGIGFSEEAATNSKSFGIRLIKGLVSDISGDIQIENHHGTTVRVLFRIDTLNGRQNR